MATSNVINVLLSTTAVTPRGVIGCGVQGDDNVTVLSVTCDSALYPNLDDGTCTVNGYCKVSNGGTATAADSGYKVLKRMDDTHVSILYR